MTCLYCHTVALSFKKKKGTQRYNGGGERDTFALMYCRVDGVQQMAPIKKRVIDYGFFSFFPPPLCQAAVRSPWRLFSCPRARLPQRGPWGPSSRAIIPLSRHRTSWHNAAWNGFTNETNAPRDVCVTRPCYGFAAAVNWFFSLSLSAPRDTNIRLPQIPVSRYVIRENEPSGALAAPAWCLRS